VKWLLLNENVFKLNYFLFIMDLDSYTVDRGELYEWDVHRDGFGSSRLSVMQRIDTANSKTVYFSGKRVRGNINWKETDDWRMSEMNHLPSEPGMTYTFNQSTHKIELVESAESAGSEHVRKRRRYTPQNQRRFNNFLFT
jgi:hypothetical protein